MSVVVLDLENRILAADTFSQRGDVQMGAIAKLKTTGQGIAAGVGYSHDLELYCRKTNLGLDINQIAYTGQDSYLVVVQKDGRVYLVDCDTNSYEQFNKGDGFLGTSCICLGVGAEYAYAALYAGYSAVEAVYIASRLCPSVSAPVDFCKWHKSHGGFSFNEVERIAGSELEYLDGALHNRTRRPQ